MDAHVIVLARLIVDSNGGARSIDVRLPDIPVTGDVIELADGARCRVQGIVTAPAEASTVTHYVYAIKVDTVNVVEAGD